MHVQKDLITYDEPQEIANIMGCHFSNIAKNISVEC